MTTSTPELTPVLRPSEVAKLVRDQTNVRLLDVRTAAGALVAVGSLPGFMGRAGLMLPTAPRSCAN